MNQSITLDKHEMVVDKETIEALVKACAWVKEYLELCGTTNDEELFGLKLANDALQLAEEL